MKRRGTPLILLSAHGNGSSAADRVARPRTDYEALAARLGGRISRPVPGAGPLRPVEQRIRLGISQAVRARRAGASVYVSLSERVGIPLALLRPARPHVMIAHLLTTG